MSPNATRRRALWTTLAVIAAAGLTHCPPKQTQTDAGPVVKNKVKVQFFIMSQCPYGTQVQEGIAPTLEKMGPYIDFKEDFIASKAPDGTFSCLHGEPECKGNIAELCAAKHAPDKYFKMILCMAKDRPGIPDNWKKCATDAGIDPAPIETCYTGQEGKDLLAASSKLAEEKGARGSPTIFVNDQPYRGGRTAEAFEIAVCMALPDAERPKTCPVVKESELTILNDKRCKECGVRAQSMKTQFESMFLKLKTNEVDWADQAGQDIAKKTGVKLLPAYIFHESAKEDPGWEMISRHVEPAGGYFVIIADRVRSTFDPTKEVCDNGVDDTGNGLVDCKDPDCQFAQVCRENCTDGVDNTDNGLIDCKDPDCEQNIACMEKCEDGVDNTGDGLVDCADPDCKETLICRKEMPKSLDLFVMSFCPYGLKAEQGLKEVIANFGANMKFKLHFITSVLDEKGYQDFPRKQWCEKYADGNYYCSMHGKEETEENLRQICAQALAPKTFMDFVWCRADNPRDPDWKKCAATAKIDPVKLEACQAGDQGKKLLKAESVLTKTLNINGSPTYLWNNKKIERAAPDPEAIKTVFCTQNAGTPGCEKTLSGPPAPPPGTPGMPGMPGAPKGPPPGGACGG